MTGGGGSTEPALQGALPTPDATDRLGEALAKVLKGGDFVALRGGLGVGKSHLARAVIRAKLAAEGRSEETPSPTYTLVQSYETRDGPVRHADLYRLSGADEIEEIGLFEAAELSIILVEWPERLGALAPSRRLEIQLEIAPAQEGGAPGRLIEARAHGEGWRDVLSALKASLDAPGA